MIVTPLHAGILAMLFLLLSARAVAVMSIAALMCLYQALRAVAP